MNATRDPVSTGKVDSQTVIVWFRQDLRLADNPALHAAVSSGKSVLPIYILDDEEAGEWAMGGASRWWLHQSLAALNKELDGRLRFFKGRAEQIIPQLAKRVNAAGIFWNRCYEPWRVSRDTKIKSALSASGCKVRSFNGSLLFEPQDVSKADGTPYKVFTPFYRKGCLQNAPLPRIPLAKPDTLILSEVEEGVSLDDLGLMPEVSWFRSIEKEWKVGESAAQARLKVFIDGRAANYKVGRDRPDQDSVSRLSPHLHFGEISPQQVWYAAKAVDKSNDDLDHFLSEIGWREFSYSLLYHWPDLPRENLQRKFNWFPWREDQSALECWQSGNTGFPIIDAGMRELWQTGYMHNRVRMITASFLVKNLLLHWHHGEDWFWDTLVDADLANNSASWQWVAGCGADAAPYFRIFNPVTQGKKFDSDGVYVRRYIPELAELPNKFIQCPWEAPAEVLVKAGVTLGQDYPEPIVDLKESRLRALDAFKSLSAGISS